VRARIVRRPTWRGNGDPSTVRFRRYTAPMSSDTTPEQAEAHSAVIRRMTTAQRADALRSVDRGVRRLVFARLRQRHPADSEQSLVVRHVAQVHGVEVARRVYGWLPPGLGT